jgi:hypothetical protein
MYVVQSRGDDIVNPSDTATGVTGKYQIVSGGGT